VVELSGFSNLPQVYRDPDGLGDGGGEGVGVSCGKERCCFRPARQGEGGKLVAVWNYSKTQCKNTLTFGPP